MRSSLGLWAVLLTMPLGLQPGMAFEKENRPCSADIEKFCKDVQPGEGRIVQCLKAHNAELSSECKEKGQELKEKANAFKEACKEDADKFCKDVPRGHGARIQCLKDHEADLSPTCKEKMSSMNHRRGLSDKEKD